MPGLSLAADADSVIEWLDRLSLDETVFDTRGDRRGRTEPGRAHVEPSDQGSWRPVGNREPPPPRPPTPYGWGRPERPSTGKWSSLHLAARARGVFALEVVETLLANGAEPNARTAHGAGNKTPLAVALEVLSVRPSRFPALDIIRALLRRGAKLDSICGSDSAETRMWRIERLRPEVCQEQNWLECRDMFECLRALGSWKAYARRPHVRMLVLRALVVRDRATTRDVTLRRLVTLPDVVLWRVLSFWRATE